MKITKTQLRRIIREEKRKVLAENRVRRLVRRALREQTQTIDDWFERRSRMDAIRAATQSEKGSINPVPLRAGCPVQLPTAVRRKPAITAIPYPKSIS